jgi:PAS domain S-box-containing protein
MVKYLVVVLLVLPGMALMNGPTSDLAAGSKTVIRVGAYENYPKIYTDNTGKVSGIFPRILDSIAKSEDWELQYVHGNWSQCLDMLQKNQIDIMVDVAYSDQRNVTFDFNKEVVMNNWGVIYSRPSVVVNSILDLDGKKIGVMKQSIHTDGPNGIKALVDSFHMNCTFLEVEDYTKVFELLDSGEADLGVVNRIFGEAFQKDYNIRKTNVIFDSQEIFFGFPKNASVNVELIGKIDADLKKMKADPNSVYYHVFDDYLVKKNTKEILPGWAVPLALGSLGVILLLVIFNIVLQWRVKVRTKELRQANVDLKDDIEKREGVEEALRANDERLRLVLENTSDVILTTKLSGEVTCVSPQVSRWGFTDADVLQGRSLAPILGQQIKRVVSEDPELVKTRRPFSLEFEIETPALGTRYLEAGCSFMKTKGSNHRVIVVLRDATERRQADEEKKAHLIQKSRAELTGFMLSALPVFSSLISPDVRNVVTQKFAQLYELNVRPGFEAEMAADPDRLNDKSATFESYLTWLSFWLGNIGITSKATTKDGRTMLTFHECPWTKVSGNNPMFCLLCRTMVIRSYSWTGLTGDVAQHSSLADGSRACAFEFDPLSGPTLSGTVK